MDPVLALLIIIFIGLVVAVAVRQAGNKSSKTLTSSSYEAVEKPEVVEESRGETSGEPDRSSRQRSRRRRITRSLDKLIVELHKQGYTARQIAEKLGISRSTVYRRLKKALKKSSVKH